MWIGLLLAVTLHSDPAIARALDLLGADAPAVSITVVVPQRSTGGISGKWDARNDGTMIEVANDSDMYKRAQRGDAIALAAAIAHEAFHISNGPAEPPAYGEQIRTLVNLHASGRDIRATVASMRYVADAHALYLRLHRLP